MGERPTRSRSRWLALASAIVHVYEWTRTMSGRIHPRRANTAKTACFSSEHEVVKLLRVTSHAASLVCCFFGEKMQVSMLRYAYSCLTKLIFQVVLSAIKSVSLMESRIFSFV